MRRSMFRPSLCASLQGTCRQSLSGRTATVLATPTALPTSIEQQQPRAATLQLHRAFSVTATNQRRKRTVKPLWWHDEDRDPQLAFHKEPEPWQRKMRRRLVQKEMEKRLIEDPDYWQDVFVKEKYKEMWYNHAQRPGGFDYRALIEPTPQPKFERPPSDLSIEPEFVLPGQPPRPSRAYLKQAMGEPYKEEALGSELPPLLVVIDLNGTILYRPDRKKRPKVFEARPYAREFLRYCVDTFWVVVWSSAMPDNVDAMCRSLLEPEDREKLVAVWGRDRFGLSPAAMTQKVVCYKRLTTLWNDLDVIAAHPDPYAMPGCWNQTNTVLIDDTREKARQEPYNLILVPEFKGKGSVQEARMRVLPEVHDYLNRLTLQPDVSRYIRANPIRFVGNLRYTLDPPIQGLAGAAPAADNRSPEEHNDIPKDPSWEIKTPFSPLGKPAQRPSTEFDPGVAQVHFQPRNMVQKEPQPAPPPEDEYAGLTEEEKHKAIRKKLLSLAKDVI